MYVYTRFGRREIAFVFVFVFSLFILKIQCLLASETHTCCSCVPCELALWSLLTHPPPQPAPPSPDLLPFKTPGLLKSPPSRSQKETENEGLERRRGQKGLQGPSPWLRLWVVARRGARNLPPSRASQSTQVRLLPHAPRQAVSGNQHSTELSGVFWNILMYWQCLQNRVLIRAKNCLR